MIDRRRAHISDVLRERVDMSFRICGNHLYCRKCVADIALKMRNLTGCL